MKKLLGLLLFFIGLVLPGLKAKTEIQYNKIDKKDNLSQEDEQIEIQKKLKGLGYFQ